MVSAAKLRFPVVFGTMLIGVYVTFTNRHFFLQNIEAERAAIFPDNPEGRKLLNEVKEELRLAKNK